jgi:SAM-dependent methyltransferase
MPLTLNFLERFGLMKLNQGPGPMADLLGHIAFKAVYTALRLGIFESLTKNNTRIDDIAASLSVDTTGLSLLLGALESLGYVKKRSGKWQITPMTRKWMLHKSPYTVAPLFFYFNDIASRWEYLEESIRSGKPPILGYEWLDKHPEKWDFYHAGLKSAALLLSREILKKIKIPHSARKLLDIGGSHGQYCIEFCKKHPHLQGVIYDWPQAEKIALRNIESSGMHGRVAFQAGDFVKDELGIDYDAILMFNIIRIFKSGELQALLEKIYKSLKRKGILVILDHLGHFSCSKFMKANAYLILLELYNSTSGRTHKAGEVITMLQQAGLSKICEYKLKRSPGLGLIVAAKI